MKEFIEEKYQEQIESEIFPIFEEKCQLCEKDSYICTLIREDSVEEFVSHVNRTNLSLYTQIEPSIYETNSFLIRK